MVNYTVAYYIELKNNAQTLVNANLDLGNPGVGGTPYLFLLTVKYLNRLVTSNYAVLLTDCEVKLNDNEMPVRNVGTAEQAIDFCNENKISTIVFNANLIDRINRQYYKKNIRFMFWAHNTLDWKRQCIAAAEKNIEYIVCVSKTQCDNMKDTPCFAKCVYVNNVIPSSFYDGAKCTNYAHKYAIYVGSIMPQKGVHNLLELWRYVEQKVPDAELFIFGGAKIWNANTKLGVLGISDEYYDRVILKRLNQLKNKKNIHFMGPKGWDEINSLINEARVGIVNPSYYMRDETFCLSAIEMEAHGLPIVSRQRNDGINTAVSVGYSGFLEENNRDIADKIVSLLSDKELSQKMGQCGRIYVRQFLVENEVIKWKNLVEKSNRVDPILTAHIKKSNDAKLLEHDYKLKLLYTIESGKFIHLIKKRLFNKS